MRYLYLPNSRNQQRQFEKPNFCAYPWLLAAEATKRRNDGNSVTWSTGLQEGKEIRKEGYDKIITGPEGLPFLSLPSPDRTLTMAHSNIYQNNGNFKYTPGTYIQAANGCWHGRCTFCVEQNNKYEVREVESVIDELKEIKSQGYKEVFDDSATFPTGRWLSDFISKYDFPFRFGCNMRLVDTDYIGMRRCGFRMLLFGLESANQSTLDTINKGVKVEDYKYIIKAAKAGLEPHVSFIVGFPWESDAEAFNTIRLVQYLLRKGYAKTAQASFYCPQKGSPQEKEVGKECHKRYVPYLYYAAFYPDFWWNKLRDIKSVDDVKYLLRGIRKGISALWEGKLT